MVTKVLFFGAAADAVGERSVEIAELAGSTAEEAIVRLRNAYPLLANQKINISINQEYAPPNAIVDDGDEIAIFTAVSGG
ncbi:MAG TPA: MoaD/ThiS family protein [Pyrinomonadaceae bacterium]|nr:MoaD/ThiS family protein [Pyrinomonadaceae bacterium]